MSSRLSRSLAGLEMLDMSCSLPSSFLSYARPGQVRAPGSTRSLLARPSHRSPLNPFLEQLALKDTIHIDAWGVDQVRLQFADLDQLLNLRNRHAGSCSHYGIKVLRCLAIHQVTPLVALPCFYQREIRLQSALHHVLTSIELARLFVLGDYGTHSARREKCGDASAAGANPLGKSALQNHLLEQLVFPNVGPDVLANLPCGQQQTIAEAVHSNVITDGGKVLHAFANQCANEVFRDSTQAEASDHDGGSVEDVLDGFVGAGHDFVHKAGILNEN